MKRKKEEIKVAILMGSKSDLEIMVEAKKILDQFDVGSELVISSCHRSPIRNSEYAMNAQSRGIEVIIAGAGGAAHLAGSIAARTLIPVIGVPIGSSSLGGWDSLLSTVQMPAGIPVATMAIGKDGAKNGALFALQILSLKDPLLLSSLKRYREDLALAVEESQSLVKE